MTSRASEVVLIRSGQLAELLGVTTSYVSRLARQGVLKPANMTLGGHHRWDVAQLQADALARVGPMRGSTPTRNRAVRLASILGASKDQIGFAVGITNSRVRQILDGDDKRSRAVAARWAEEAAENGGRELGDAVRLARTLGVSIPNIARATGVSRAHVRKIIRE